MFKPKLILLFPFLLACGSASAGDVSTYARNVVDAIRRNRFYIIPHDDGLEAIRRRFQRIEHAVRDREPA